jgi:hypothetical protein
MLVRRFVIYRSKLHAGVVRNASLRRLADRRGGCEWWDCVRVPRFEENDRGCCRRGAWTKLLL